VRRSLLKTYIKESSIASYIYVVECLEDFKLSIKSLGNLKIERGTYLYVGSANIKRPYLRVIRHLTKNFKKPKWHIDYITINCQPKLGVLCYGIDENFMWDYIVKHDHIFTPYVKGFGASDTPHHNTHLFKVVSTDVINSYNAVVKTFLKLKACSHIEFLTP